MPRRPCDRASAEVILPKHVEHVGQMLRGNANAGINHPHHYCIVQFLSTQGNRAFAFGVLCSIDQQV